MHQDPPFRPKQPEEENISGTILRTRESAKIGLGEIADEDDWRRRCAFITAEAWPAGTLPPFCGAPTRAGSAYCARHARLCTLDPARGDSASVEDQASDVPPRALRHLVACAVPEFGEDDARDALDEWERDGARDCDGEAP